MRQDSFGDESEDPDKIMKFESVGPNSKRSAVAHKDESPPQQRVEDMLKNEILQRKAKNEANQQLAKFKKCLQKQDHNNQIITSTEKISLIPSNLREDLDEALLYVYFAVRYYDEHIFKVILTRTNRFSQNRDLHQLLSKDFNNLTTENSYSRYRLNQIAFEVALDKDYIDVAFHFIETSQIHISWEMVRKMIDRRQEYLVKQCIKYGSKFDPGSASLKKIVFAGRTAAPLEDRAIKLVDFIQVMLELKWKTKEILEVLKNYSKKGKIDTVDLREMFLMFAIKRKIKLMSYLINGDEFLMEFQEANFIDVIENDVFDIAVLLHREYFLTINSQHQKINTLLVNSFSRSNGMLEAKCFLLKRFVNKLSFEQANKLLEAVESKVFDSSKGNILLLTLNVVKASCLLIEVLEKVRSRFSFLGRRVYEVKQKIIKIAQDFMNDIQSEEEMRFLLLEKDLDERDSLNIIYDYEILDLLEHPFAQNIVQQIWQSQYNNSHSIFSVSSIHTLLFNYNHCRYDLESNLRFYKKRDLPKYGCHGFQFQVWRYSGESRHLVNTVTTWLWIIWVHIKLSKHMDYVNYCLGHQNEIKNYQSHYTYMLDPLHQGQFSKTEMDITHAIYDMWLKRLLLLEEQTMDITFMMFLSWLFLFQKIFDAIFAGKNKRVPHMVNVGFFLDFGIFMIGLIYIFIVYKDWRWDTWLQSYDPPEFAWAYWYNYSKSYFNENGILLSYGVVFWMKAFYQLKLISVTGSLFAIMVKLLNEMFIFAIFYFSQLFLYSVVGVVLFNDLENFQHISTAMFTLFRATIQDYDVDQMKHARIGAFLGYCYFLSFLIINLILIVNLIVGQLSYAYKYYSKRRGILFHLSTLSVREVSEADEKYSAVISAPFPLNLLNFIFGGIVISMKSPQANVLLLIVYYLPVFIFSLIAFVLYQYIMLPFCYIKIVGHKFALMVKSPQGQGARSTCDRAFQAILFLILGPFFLGFNSIVDVYWYLMHMFKFDLDKSHLQTQQTTAIHRRTYKKMYKYFEQKNEQLVPQKKVSEDLRQYLDVMEGIRCLLYGKPNHIPENKAGLYMAYAKEYIEKSQGKQPNFMQKLQDSEVEQVVKEFEVVKQVLLNNSFPVDMNEIQQNSVKKKGWGMSLLFDKKVFFSILQDLERMRKVLNLKKCFFIFHIPYDGKPQEMNSWHKKVESRVNMTLKFLNTARLLRIIGYDPVLHIKSEHINFAKDMTFKLKQNNNNNEGTNNDILHLKDIRIEPSLNNQRTSKGGNPQKFRVDSLQQNMQTIMTKYANAGRQMKDIADIMKKFNQSNNNNTKQQQQQKQHLGYHKLDNQDADSKRQKSQVLPVHDDELMNAESGVKQPQVNYHSPSRYGVISPASVSGLRKPEQQENVSSKQKNMMNVHYTDRSNSEAVISSDDDEDQRRGQKEDINSFPSKKK